MVMTCTPGVRRARWADQRRQAAAGGEELGMLGPPQSDCSETGLQGLAETLEAAEGGPRRMVQLEAKDSSAAGCAAAA